MRFAPQAGAALLVLSLLFQPAFAQEAATPPVASETPVAEVSEPVATSTPVEPAPAPEPIPEIIPEPEIFEPKVATTREPGPIEEPVAAELPEGAEYVPGEVIVKFKESKVDLERASGEVKVEAFAEAQSVEVVEELAPANLVIVETEETVAETIATLEADPLVEYAEPNYLYTIEGGGTDGSDEYWNTLWALRNTGQLVDGGTGTADADLDAPEAWELSRGTGVIVAVVDTGVAYDHPDLADNMWDGSTCVNETGVAITNGCTHGYDFYRDNADPLPSFSDHGTHVAGTIAAVGNTVGTIGVAPEAKIMALRTDYLRTYANGTTEVLLDSFEIARAIDFARENDVRIINASFGGGGESMAIYQAIENFGAEGGIVVAAAGNDSDNNDNEPFYPASYDLDNIIVVAASDQHDQLTDFSNYGATSVDVAAPGYAIRSTGLGSSVSDITYEYKDGTSMAAPHVSGIAALLLAYDPTLTVAELKAAILDTGDTIPALSGKVASGKRVNAFNALASVATTTVTGTLEVVTEVTNDNGRSATVSATSFRVDNGRSTAQGATGTTTLTLAPGTYAVEGVTLANYTLATSTCTSLSVTVGSTTTCTLSYNDNPDTLAPTITLTGSNPQTLTIGQAYTELGATAIDDLDGTLASTSISIDATSVNTSLANTYGVVYTVADAAGNVASTTRSVVISNPPSSGGGGGGGGGGGDSSKSKKTTKKEVKKKVKKTTTTKKTTKKPEPLPKPVATPAAPLGYTTYRFNFDMGVGATGTDVTELQKILVAKGYLFVAPTGYYGSMTAGALRQYQLANAISSTGYLGPLTRAALNAGK